MRGAAAQPWRSAPEYQKQIIDTFVNSVYVYDDRLVMTYNYKDDIRTIVPMPSFKPLIRICQVMLHFTGEIRT